MGAMAPDDTPDRGLDRGPLGLAKAWVEVLVYPRRFFRTRVVPGEQAPGLMFALTVVAIEEASRFAVVDGAAPVFAGRPVLSFALALGVVVLLVAPAALHLVAAVVTLALVALADERAGVSETVQVVGYATAPCVLAGLPIPALRVLCAGYATVLLVVGIAEVHRLDTGRAILVATLPAVLAFGFAFRGFAAAAVLVGRVG